jgi:transposase-like protein
MRPISFKRHRFPPDVIRHAVWLYLRFTLSIRDVEELLASGASRSAAKPFDAGSTSSAR